MSPDDARALPGPEWLVRRRVAAAERAAALPRPTPDEEIWRYSRIEEVDLDRFPPAPAAVSVTGAGACRVEPAESEAIVDAHRLGLDIGAADTLERYASWRRADNLTMVAATDLLTRLFSNDVKPLRLARDAGLAAVNRLPPLRRFFARHAMGVVGDLPKLMRGERP